MLLNEEPDGGTARVEDDFCELECAKCKESVTVQASYAGIPELAFYCEDCYDTVENPETD